MSKPCPRPRRWDNPHAEAVRSLPCPSTKANRTAQLIRKKQKKVPHPRPTRSPSDGITATFTKCEIASKQVARTPCYARGRHFVPQQGYPHFPDVALQPLDVSRKPRGSSYSTAVEIKLTKHMWYGFRGLLPTYVFSFFLHGTLLPGKPRSPQQQATIPQSSPILIESSP